jgi:hypothetical protein
MYAIQVVNSCDVTPLKFRLGRHHTHESNPGCTQKLPRSGAVKALMEASEPRGGPDSSSRVALYSLGTVAAYAECKEVGAACFYFLVHSYMSYM